MTKFRYTFQLITLLLVVLMLLIGFSTIQSNNNVRTTFGDLAWTQPRLGERAFSFQTKLFANDPYSFLYGHAVAIEGDTALVGVPGEERVYVYTRTEGTWSQQTILSASDGQEFDRFGYTLALQGDTAVIGVGRPGIAYVGVAYVFVRNGSEWVEQAKLVPTTPQVVPRDYALAYSGNVALDQDTVVIIDDSDRVTVFVRNGTTWSQQAQLSSDGSYYIGQSVAIDGNTLVIGDSEDSEAGNYAGAAYIFVRQGTTWTEQAKLIASDALSRDFFGGAVDIDDDRVLIGATGHFTLYNGSAYIFTRSGTTWTEQQKLSPNSSGPFDKFGWPVVIRGNTALIATNGESFGGSVYVFKYDGSMWQLDQRLMSGVTEGDDFFGCSLAYADGTILVGAWGDDTPVQGTKNGSVYVFVDPELQPTPTPTFTPTDTLTPTETTTNTLTATPVPPTSTSTASVTPSITVTATATPNPSATTAATDVPTPTPPFRIELLLNGGMETDMDANKIPDHWRLDNKTGDRQKCDQPGKTVAHTGICAFMFKGDIGENSILQQSVNVSTLDLPAGTAMNLSVYVHAPNVGANGKLKLIASFAHSDGTPASKLKLTVSQTNGYILQSADGVLASGEVAQIKVKLIHRSTLGKMYVDDVSLNYQPDGNTIRFESIPLP